MNATSSSIMHGEAVDVLADADLDAAALPPHDLADDRLDERGACSSSALTKRNARPIDGSAAAVLARPRTSST